MNAIGMMLPIVILFVIVAAGVWVAMLRFLRWSSKAPSSDLIQKKEGLAKEFAKKMAGMEKRAVICVDYAGWYMNWGSKENHCCKPMFRMKVYLGSDGATGNEAMYSTPERAKDNASKCITIAICSTLDCDHIYLLSVYPREGGYSFSDGGGHG
jgi:hypothetical protein